MLPLHPPPPPTDPTEAFFRQWGIINSTALPIPLPTDPQGKLALSSAMFRAGKEHLRDEIGTSTVTGALQEKLVDALRIHYNRDVLRVLRATKTAVYVGKWEEHIARSIQRLLARYAYDRHQAFPAMIARQEKMNCLGATILMGSMLEECDIRFLQGYVTRHVLTILLTADRRVVWVDPLAPHTTEEIRNAHIAPLRTDDIISYSHNPSLQNLTIHIAAEHFRNKVQGWTEDREEPALLTLFPPEEGQHAMLLDATGYALIWLKKYETAAEALRLAVAELPSYGSSHAHLGLALRYLGEKGSAHTAYERAKMIEQERQRTPPNHTTHFIPPPACRPPRSDGKTAPE